MATVLLASEHLDPHGVALGESTPGVVHAFTPGEGPSRNPKHQKNEDSLAVVALRGAVAAIVADSHWGAYTGEALTKAAASALEKAAPTTHAALADLLLDLDKSYRAARPEADRSETTLLVAILRGSRAIWASIADSHIYAVSAKSAERLNADRPIFAGSKPELRTFAERVGRDTVIDSDERLLAPGELLVLASDGIAPEDSGLQPADLARELGGAGPLRERVRRFVERARRAPGGRDNLALVVLDPRGLAS